MTSQVSWEVAGICIWLLIQSSDCPLIIEYSLYSVDTIRGSKWNIESSLLKYLGAPDQSVQLLYTSNHLLAANNQSNNNNNKLTSLRQLHQSSRRNSPSDLYEGSLWRACAYRKSWTSWRQPALPCPLSHTAWLLSPNSMSDMRIIFHPKALSTLSRQPTGCV